MTNKMLDKLELPFIDFGALLKLLARQGWHPPSVEQRQFWDAEKEKTIEAISFLRDSIRLLKDDYSMLLLKKLGRVGYNELSRECTNSHPGSYFFNGYPRAVVLHYFHYQEFEEEVGEEEKEINRLRHPKDVTLIQELDKIQWQSYDRSEYISDELLEQYHHLKESVYDRRLHTPNAINYVGVLESLLAFNKSLYEFLDIFKSYPAENSYECSPEGLGQAMRELEEIKKLREKVEEFWRLKAKEEEKWND